MAPYCVWERLLGLEHGVLLSDVGLAVCQTVRFRHYKVGEQQYVCTHEATQTGNLTYRGFAWVAGDDVADRVWSSHVPVMAGQEPSGYRGAIAAVSPPDLLLPGKGITGYRAIVEHGKSSSPETFRDAVIGAGTVAFGDYCYWFADVFPWDKALPIAIEVDRSPKLWAGTRGGS